MTQVLLVPAGLPLSAAPQPDITVAQQILALQQAVAVLQQQVAGLLQNALTID